MSYILAALKKAEQERDIGAAPRFATPQEAERPQTRSYRWLWVIAALLSVNVVLVVLLLQERGVEVPVAAEAPLERQSPPVNDQPAQPVQPASEIAIGENPIREDTVQPEHEGMPSAGELVLLPERSISQNSRPFSPPDESLDARNDAITAAEDESQLPSWYELPAAFRSKLDLPRLDLHAYSEEPQNRFILVSLKKYREGERLESGLMLEEILPDGMVMSYQGERFFVEK